MFETTESWIGWKYRTKVQNSFSMAKVQFHAVQAESQCSIHTPDDPR